MGIIRNIFTEYGLVGAFGTVALIMAVSYWFANLIGQKRMGSAIAIVLSLGLALVAGIFTGGRRGVSDIAIFSGMGLLGGSMLRDYAIIATAFGVELDKLKEAGVRGIASIFIGVFFSFLVGAVIAIIFGQRDPIAIATIGAGAVTFIVGPVTGTALGASSEVIALAIATGVVKSVVTIIATPLIAKRIGLNNPSSAMVFGGLIGTTSGVAGGLAATDPALVPYGAITAAFYTGLGCILCPSVFYIILRMIFPNV